MISSINDLLHSDYKGSALAAPAGGKGGAGEVLGVCPLCGKPVKLGKNGGYCTGYKDEPTPCKFRFWKTFFSKELTAKQISDLVSGKRVLVRGLVSQKTKKTFDAYVAFDGKVSEEGYAQLELSFEGMPPKKASGGARSKRNATK